MTREDVLAAGSFDAVCAVVILGSAFVIGIGFLIVGLCLLRQKKYEPACGCAAIGGILLIFLAMFVPMLGDLFSVWYAPNYYIERFQSRWKNAQMHIEEPPHAN